MDFLKKYWVYITLPILAAIGMGVFLFIAASDKTNLPIVPTPPDTLTKEEQDALTKGLTPPPSPPRTIDTTAHLPVDYKAPTRDEYIKLNSKTTAPKK